MIIKFICSIDLEIYIFKNTEETMKSGSNPKLDYVLINLLSQADEPSWEKALEYRHLHSNVGT